MTEREQILSTMNDLFGDRSRPRTEIKNDLEDIVTEAESMLMAIEEDESREKEEEI